MTGCVYSAVCAVTAPELLLLVGDAVGIWLLWQLRHWRHRPQPARPRVGPPSHVRILQQDVAGVFETRRLHAE